MNDEQLEPETSLGTLRQRPWLCTISGAIVGLIAIGIWIATFEPHGGPELSRYLFPGSSWWLERLYPQQDIPVFAWYADAFLHWVIIGFFADVVRSAIRYARARNA